MQLAVIREAECVGCTKCILACPVDAIIGASQFLHTVIADECIGCGLCVAPCPMDCIDMIENPLDKLKEDNEAEKTKRGTQAKARYQARQKRLILQEQPKLPIPTNPTEKQRIKEEIKAAVIRVKEKRTINPILQKNKQ